jgi:hypothetical protein
MQQDAKLPRKRGQHMMGQLPTRGSVTATRASSGAEHYLLWVQATRALHKGLPQKTIKLSKPSARQRQLRME